MSVLSNGISEDQKRFRTLQILRVLFCAGLATFFAQLLSLDLSVGWFIAAGSCGILYSGRLLKRQGGFVHAVGVHIFYGLMAWALLRFANGVAVSLSSVPPSYDFFIPRVIDRAVLLFITYFAAFLFTWWFWCRRAAATIEGLLFVVLFVFLLGGHRNYHLDAPKEISSLTWKLGFLQRLHIEPQHLFMGLGALALSALVFYFLLAANRPLFGREKVVQSRGKRQWFSALAIPSLLVAILGFYLNNLNSRYSVEISRRSEGVSEATKEGESNLGFHKAVGHTNQPTALVRLESDFENNPWAPMLYLREGALSAYNGHEFVAAPAQYDQDVPRTDPSQPFVALLSKQEVSISIPEFLLAANRPFFIFPLRELPDPYREKLAYSVYLLTQHNTPPAIDLPVRIGMVKNPDPNRFQTAYQVISMVPKLAPKDLLGRMVGNPRWDNAALNHYLRAPGSLEPSPPDSIELTADKPVLDSNNEDLRYLGMARQLTAGLYDPLSRAEAIINFLSTQSIYTRDPGHEVAKEADPVAPYLFAEKKRGYCVHFAHAAAYMLRLVGIPARIGTGYLTDLKHAKDGHILLQMGDRHAWPEVYIEGMGWVIWDVQPAMAENEQPAVPDPQLLEELMGKLNPTDELIAPPEVAETKKDEPWAGEKLFNREILIPILAALVTIFLLLKLWLRFGYLLARSPRRQTQLAYLSFASQMDDLGFSRNAGETRREYQARVAERYQSSPAPLTDLLERRFYAHPTTFSAEVSATGESQSKAAVEAIKSWQRSHDKNSSKIKRLISILNPRSLMRFGSW